MTVTFHTMSTGTKERGDEGGWRSGGLREQGDRTDGLQGGTRSGTHGGAGSSGGHGGSVDPGSHGSSASEAAALYGWSHTTQKNLGEPMGLSGGSGALPEPNGES